MIFDLVYLIFALGTGGIFLTHALKGGNAEVGLFSALALTLGAGDSFHLVPRIAGIITKNKTAYLKACGIGKFITSITMTAFYVILFALRAAYATPSTLAWVAVFSLTAIRLVICVLPQNRWQSDTPDRGWEIARNIPFLTIGAIVCASFAAAPEVPAGLRLMPAAIAASFAFYVPVIAFARKHPAVGALMIPKTLCYVWMLVMGFSLV